MKITNMAERGERRLQEHGQHVGPPVQGGRSAETHVELGGVGKPQETENSRQRNVELLTHITY